MKSVAKQLGAGHPLVVKGKKDIKRLRRKEEAIRWCGGGGNRRSVSSTGAKGGMEAHGKDRCSTVQREVQALLDTLQTPDGKGPHRC